MKKLVLLCAAVFTLGLALPVQAQEVDYIIIVPVRMQAFENEVDNNFYYYLKAGKLQDAAFLVSTRGANPNLLIDNRTGKTPLFYVAGKKGGLELAKALIEKGANVNDRDGSMMTPLHYAVGNNDKPLIELLLSNGAKINPPGRSIFDAVKTEEMAKYLISKGADANYVNESKRTLLHKYASEGNKEMVEFFIKRGAKINAQNKGGFTPLDAAQSEEVKQILIKHGAKTRDEIKKENEKKNPSVKQETKETSKVAQAKTVSLNPLDKDLLARINTLRSFNSKKDKDTVKDLLEKGANINVKDDQGKTPLHIIVSTSKNKKEIVELLLEKGAKINAKDNEGKTPLDLAQNEEVKELLTSKGAKSGKDLK